MVRGWFGEGGVGMGSYGRRWVSFRGRKVVEGYSSRMRGGSIDYHHHA